VIQAASRVLMRLNAQTRAQHSAVDWPWLELMSPDASRGRYLDHLVTIYGFESAVEAALALTPHISEIVDLRTRARSGQIVEDLLALGLSASKIARLPICRQVVPFREIAEALGWLYVIERSTLLFGTIRRYMAQQLPQVHAWHYLSAYDGMASQRWQELGLALDAYAITPTSEDAIVESARTALSCLCDWHASKPAATARRMWSADFSGGFIRE
jgi:heme oxygenase (biliverdin-IX-beta and delta-forming)